MGKVRVTISYLGTRMGHSRYGYTQRVETVVKFVEEDDLDEVLDQFRAHHEVTEITVRR